MVRNDTKAGILCNTSSKKKLRRSIRFSKNKVWQEREEEKSREAVVSLCTADATSTDDVSSFVPSKLQTNDCQYERTPIVLILIDPISRRFQFLRLEFDTAKLTVADFLQQIILFPATDESFRTQTFDYMCNLEGFEYEHDRYISDYVEGSAVIIAVSKADYEGSDDISNMAKSVLRRSKLEIDEMLKPSVISSATPQTSEEGAQQKDAITSPSDSSPDTVRRSVKPTVESNEVSMSPDYSTSSNCMAYLFMGGVLAYALKHMNKSFRGLVTSKNKKRKEIAKLESLQTIVSPSTVDTKSISSETYDDETLQTHEIMEASQSQTQGTPTSKILTYDDEIETDHSNDLVTVVLLLIDPTSRRFQFLRLEFYTNMLTVAEVLQQIILFPATDESFRTQTFDYMCNLEGFEYDYDRYISDYVEGNAVVIAVPQAGCESSDDISNMAKSVLRRSKIDQMLKSTGICLATPHTSEEDVQEEDFSQQVQRKDTIPEHNNSNHMSHQQETTSVSSIVSVALEQSAMNNHDVDVAISTSPNDLSLKDSPMPTHANIKRNQPELPLTPLDLTISLSSANILPSFSPPADSRSTPTNYDSLPTNTNSSPIQDNITPPPSESESNRTIPSRNILTVEQVPNTVVSSS